MDYKNLSPKDRIILALDVDTIEEARDLKSDCNFLLPLDLKYSK